MVASYINMNLQWLLGYFLLAVLAVVIYWISNGDNEDLPRVGSSPGMLNWKVWLARYSFYKHGSFSVARSYKCFKDGACRLHTLVRDHVVVGPKYMEELRSLPESQLSASAALVDSVLGEYNGVDINLKDNLSGDMVRGPFTRMLPEIFPSMVDELNGIMENTFSQTLNSCTTHAAYQLMYNMINQVTSRVFIGAPLCHDKRWTYAVQQLPAEFFAVMGSLFFLPDFIRPWIAPFLPAKKRLARNLAGVRGLLFPNGKIVQLNNDNVTAFKLLAQASKNKDSQEELSQRILLLTAAAMHTSCTASVNVLYDLCVMPEYIASLRSEIAAALSETSDKWTFETTKRLPHLDSFFKESQRTNPSNLLGFGRKVMTPISLPDGITTLHPGTSIRVASGEMARDPQFYSNPDLFDGDRFITPGDHQERSRDQEYTGIEPGNITWGTGRFTCPGRWYASTMMKLVLGKFILEYDFCFPEPTKQRPPNEQVDTRIMPNSTQKIVFTKR